MRGKTKIRKTAWTLPIIALLAAMAIEPAFAATTLAAPIIIDDTKGPGDFVTVDITVAEVANMLGFELVLSYDPDVLFALDFGAYPPFSVKLPSEMGPDYVAMAYITEWGDPEGFSTTTAAPIAWILFEVVTTGATVLDLHDTIITDVNGGVITHEAADGYFSNTPGPQPPIASFTWTPETPTEGQEVTFTSTSSDADGTIVSWDWDFGDLTTGAGETVLHEYEVAGTYLVTLTVTDNDGLTDTAQATIEVVPPPPPEGADLVKKKAWPEKQRFDVSTQAPNEINTLYAQVRNLNPEESTFVRVIFRVWEAREMDALGDEIVNATLAPGAEAILTVGFNVTDPRWGFDGTAAVRYKVQVRVQYLKAGFWTELPDATVKWFSMWTAP